MLKTKEISPLMQQLLASIKGSKDNINIPSSHGKEIKEKAHAKCESSISLGWDTHVEADFLCTSLKKDQAATKMYGKELLLKLFKDQYATLYNNWCLVRSWFDDVHVDLHNNPKGKEAIKDVISRNMH